MENVDFKTHPFIKNDVFSVFYSVEVYLKGKCINRVDFRTLKSAKICFERLKCDYNGIDDSVVILFKNSFEPSDCDRSWLSFGLAELCLENPFPTEILKDGVLQ